ncbi:MAG: DNA mismatch endonuclease Vsr, partial [Hyphomicrobiales bacterium]|nr:DNA mismatch endonuclease Vsr [Hyphomicrobiales bacterium]MCC2103990.1 DNA mismatch endonuclease Vsr [Hyphomicrobiales bacterium]
IPGNPDIAFLGAKKAIFVHGCFWHGHDCRRGARMPKTNTDYWRAKIGRNRARDARHLEDLAALGWRALVVWECELADETALVARLRVFCGH